MRKKVLIVEGNPTTVDLLEEMFESLGYDFIVATNGKQAVCIAAAQLPDIISLDISPPRMDGFEVARLVCQNPKTHSIPILAVTARSLPNDRKVCLESSCDGYLSKPFTRQ